MPRTRPREISNGVSLSDKLGRKDLAFVAEDGAVDTVLSGLGVIDKSSPNKEGVCVEGPQDNVLARPNELLECVS